MNESVDGIEATIGTPIRICLLVSCEISYCVSYCLPTWAGQASIGTCAASLRPARLHQAWPSRRLRGRPARHPQGFELALPCFCASPRCMGNSLARQLWPQRVKKNAHRSPGVASSLLVSRVAERPCQFRHARNDAHVRVSPASETRRLAAFVDRHALSLGSLSLGALGNRQVGRYLTYHRCPQTAASYLSS